MKKIYRLSLFMFLVAFFTKAQDINFNKSWKFLKDKAEGAEKPEFNDAKWRTLNLPHDWAIEGPFDTKYNVRCGGLPFYGTGWYRKKFKMPPKNKGKVVRIEFEGAMYNAHVWINGHFLGKRPYGYIGFEYNMSKYLNYDNSDNVIAVRLTPEDSSSRWYPGAGLYRSVWLRIDEPIYIDTWGTYFKTPTVTDELAVVQNETTIINKKNIAVEVKIQHDYISPTGQRVASEKEKITIPPNSKQVSATYVSIEDPKKWNTKTPHLYNVITKLYKDGVKIDSYLTRIGLRSIYYNAKGFFLNGEKIRFNGVCLHHDNGGLGTAVYRRADERKLQIMKRMGANAIKTSHNPPSRELLELCDELGLMVLDEAFDTWEKEKVPNGYNKFFKEWAERDLKDMIRRDRNHPSVIMWSIGNKIKEQSNRKNGYKTAKKLHDYCVEMDPSRPTTMGMNDYIDPYVFNFAQQVQVSGVNHKPSKYEELHQMFPQLPIYGSETSSCTSSRGIYHLPIEKYQTHKSLHVTSYDIIGPSWAYPPDIEFHFQEKNPNVMGQFIWTGFDYLGEPTPYGGRENLTTTSWNEHWPSHASYFGAVDMCGFPKDRYYLYQSHWTQEPMIHLLPHWNWKGMEGQNIPVYCYTNCDEAELFVNGVSMGKKIKGKDLTEIKVNFVRYKSKTFQSKYRLSWEVPYRKGNIKVVGYKNGKAVKETQIFTAGKPSKVELSVDRSVIKADGNDLAYITAQIKDRDGNLCPNTNNLVKFSIKGEGILAAVDNGNQISLESFQEPRRKAFSGKCLLVVKSTENKGKITIEAKSKLLKSSKIVFYSK